MKKRNTATGQRLRAVVADAWGFSEKAERLRKSAAALESLQECGDRADKLLHEVELAKLRRRIARAVRHDRDSR